jgi:hypothetical protein
MMTAEEEVNYEFSEVPVSASVTTAQRATPEELVAMAKKIWRAVRDSKVAKADDAGNDRLLGQLQTEYKDFATSFPLVLRWMVQTRTFKAKAFHDYLKLHAAAKITTREDFLRLQAEYVVLLWRAEHPHPDEKVVRRYREDVSKQLIDEDKAFMEIHKRVEADLAVKAGEDDRDRRRRLVEFLKSRVEAADGAAPAKTANSS